MTSEIKVRAFDAATRQLIDIKEAIDLLTGKANELMDHINPNAATWQDVAKFAHVHDCAKEVIERLQIEVE